MWVARVLGTLTAQWPSKGQWLDTDLAFRKRDTIKYHTPIEFFINFDCIICNIYVKGHKKIQTPRILLRRDTIRDLAKHVSSRSLSFIWISQFFINSFYNYFSHPCGGLSLSLLTRASCIILFIARSPYSLCKWDWF